jgi:hypothetical protein
MLGILFYDPLVGLKSTNFGITLTSGVSKKSSSKSIKGFDPPGCSAGNRLIRHIRTSQIVSD